MIIIIIILLLLVVVVVVIIIPPLLLLVACLPQVPFLLSWNFRQPLLPNVIHSVSPSLVGNLVIMGIPKTYASHQWGLNLLNPKATP